MSKRRERKVKDLCDATPTLSEPKVTPILSGNVRMQGPVDETNSEVTSQLTKSFSGLNRSQKVDDRGVCGTCNVCSAPCSSCFHIDKVLTKSNDESAVEACADNIVVAEHRQYESGQTSEASTVAEMMSTSNSFSKNARGKGSSKTYEELASDDNVLHSKHGVSEGHDDCLSCASGTDELTSAKDELEDSMIKYNRKRKFSGDSSDKVVPNNSLAELSLQVENPLLKTTDDASTVPLKGQNASSLASKEDEKDDKPSYTKDKLIDRPTKHLNSVLDRETENGGVSSDRPLSATNFIAKNENKNLEVHPTDEAEADDSDMVEQDVKVCDICGDAGREDLLAVCSRCSDGAEHTYCMREMLDKVPEGEWLCEECKSMEGVENERREKIGKLEQNEKVDFSAQASSEQGNSSDSERNKANGEIKHTGKRRRDDADVEVSSIVKKPATVHTIGSPKTKNIGKTVPSSLDNFSKNRDKSKLKSLPSNTPRGTLSKTTSFNSLASKPKIKLVDQVVIQRQKSAKELASFRPKDGVSRLMGKSMSFKSTMSSRSESKTKTLSPRPSHIQDKKNIKDRSSFERQHSFRSEQPLTNSMMGTSKNATSRIDKLAASRLESSTPMAVVNQREKKAEYTDGKSVALSRSSSFVARRNIESSSSLGEFKRPPVNIHNTVGVSSTNGQKSSHTGAKEDISSSSVVAERAHYNANDGLPDAMPRGRDIANSGERMKGHAGTRFLPPYMRSSRDELREPGVDRKHKTSDQTDASHQDHCTEKKKSFSDLDHPEESKLSGNVTAASLKQETISDVNKSSLVNSDGFLLKGDGVPILSSFQDGLDSVSTAVPFFLNSAAIPEHEYIWQGSFEIYRSGRKLELWDGIQAHLSTCASPKVVQAANKFESKMIFCEVPRLSTWPVQFQEHGVKEDNIALFFFAKDIESYHKIYKILVDKMIANDLALRGNVDGVELLIFPSSQLPDNMKRWNMVFYVWGVFRGKRESCSTDIPNSSLVPIVSGLPVSGNAVPITGSESEESHNLLPSRTVKEGHRMKISNLDESDSRLKFSSSAAIQNNGTSCQESKGSYQEQDLSSSVLPPVQDMRSSSGCQKEKLPIDTPVDGQPSPHINVKSEASTNNIASDGVSGNRIIPDKASNKEQSSIMIKDEDSSKDEETAVMRKPKLKDLNMVPEEWPLDQGLLSNGETLVEPCGAPMSHVPSVSGDHWGNPERHLFSIESKPVKVTGLVDEWKIHPLEQNQLHNKSPNLELALWAESKSSTMEIHPMLGKQNEECVNMGAGIKAEDDVSASLSLSLSFPFPETEQRPKHGPKLEQKRKPVNSNTSVFGL